MEATIVLWGLAWWLAMRKQKHTAALVITILAILFFTHEAVPS